jgi:hypothetical protein
MFPDLLKLLAAALVLQVALMPASTVHTMPLAIFRLMSNRSVLKPPIPRAFPCSVPQDHLGLAFRVESMVENAAPIAMRRRSCPRTWDQVSRTIAVSLVEEAASTSLTRRVIVFDAAPRLDLPPSLVLAILGVCLSTITRARMMSVIWTI